MGGMIRARRIAAALLFIAALLPLVYGAVMLARALDPYDTPAWVFAAWGGASLVIGLAMMVVAVVTFRQSAMGRGPSPRT